MNWIKYCVLKTCGNIGTRNINYYVYCVRGISMKEDKET